MSVRASAPKHMDAATRAAKNARIKASMNATRKRRAAMRPKVFRVKISARHLSAGQSEALERLFLEAKWVRNSAVGASRFDDAYLKDLGGSVGVRLPDGSIDNRRLLVLGGQQSQAVMAELRDNLKALKALKAHHRRVGRLKFTRRVTSINLKQFGSTYRVDAARGRVKIANIPGWVRVRGLDQLAGAEEYANAKLLNTPAGYYLAITTYAAANTGSTDFQPGTSVGLDLGLKTHVTLSDGTKVSAMFEETDRLRRLRRKLARQTKGSANTRRTKALIARECARITRRKDDFAAKLAHEILKNERVYIQDESISAWKTRHGAIRGGKRVQASILGRLKTRLAAHPRVTVLPKSAATTATCICGVKTKHTPDMRVFVCPSCGYTRDRDIHAAENMIRFGEAQNPLHPGQMETLAETSVRPAATMNLAFTAEAGSRSTKQEAVPSSATP